MSEPEDDDATLPLIPGGVSLRDWFAGQAVACLGGSYDIGEATRKTPATFSATLAKAAYLIADAMLAERRK